jgi:drug/metabolite transporter (DMT)-like permease
VTFLRSQAAAFLLLPLAALCWAGNHVLARAAGGHVPPASLAVVRWIIVALVILPFALPHLRVDWPRMKAKPGLMVLFAVTGGGAFGTLQFVALHFTTALNMGVVGSVAPAFIVAASWLLFRERLAPLQLAGVLVSLLGTLAIVSRLDLGRIAGFSFNAGDLIIIANMVLWAVYASCLRVRPAIHATTFMLSMAAISAVGNLPFAMGEHAFGYRLQPTWLTAATLLYATFITTIVAYVAWNRGVDIVGAPRASAFLHTIPLFAAVLATTLLGETIETYHVLGFALILAGVTLVARQSQVSDAQGGVAGKQKQALLTPDR